MFGVKCQRLPRRLKSLIRIAGQQVVEAKAGDQSRVKRIEFQGAAAFPGGFVAAARPQEDVREEVPHVGIGGVQPKGTAKTPLRLGPTPLEVEFAQCRSGEHTAELSS